MSEDSQDTAHPINNNLGETFSNNNPIPTASEDTNTHPAGPANPHPEEPAPINPLPQLTNTFKQYRGSTGPKNPPFQSTNAFNQYRDNIPGPSESPHLGLRQRITPPAPSVSSKNSVVYFLEKETRMPIYKGPVKGVKIKPLDKELCFDGTNLSIENFINRYENVGSTDGASSIDLVRQVVSFLKGEAIKEEVEQMEAYRNQNWEDLKIIQYLV
ncbi:hypothetical protein PTTG_28171 [Puccinia triticina 1-1 BBBD Race 1]|uniref:Uncharacterized protein n=1 Tax=Puccinia triticina (isolate 1-1 / race 1 (BBBD)) TaxID=630390 RepID=A0A180GE54_PUCT1|nr:hypothetical protein PTTG_28171 [Puccinia triticina 1-1 BBBD Race 1]